MRRLPDEEQVNHVFVWEARKGAATGYVCQNCGMAVPSNDVARAASGEECQRDESACENPYSHNLLRQARGRDPDLRSGAETIV